MSVPRRPFHLVAVAVLVLLGSVALPACTGGQTIVKDYGNPSNLSVKDYYDDFMYGCTGVSVDPQGATPTKATPKYDQPEFQGFDYCKCVYDGMKAKVPFSDAKAFEDEQAKATKGADGKYDITIPKNIQAVMDGCSSKQN